MDETGTIAVHTADTVTARYAEGEGFVGTKIALGEDMTKRTLEGARERGLKLNKQGKPVSGAQQVEMLMGFRQRTRALGARSKGKQIDKDAGKAYLDGILNGSPTAKVQDIELSVPEYVDRIGFRRRTLDVPLGESISGPGDKMVHGVAKNGKISQSTGSGEDDRMAGRYGAGGVGVGGGAAPPPQVAKGGGAHPDEDEMEKDIIDMDKEPVSPKSPLGNVVAQAFDQPTDEPKKDDKKEKDKEPQNEGVTGPTLAQVRGRATEISPMFRTRMNLLRQLVKEFPDANRGILKQAMYDIVKRKGISEDYKGEEQNVETPSGNPIDVPEDEFKEAQKTEPTQVVQMDEPFVVNTKEGPADGKAGDFLAKGVEGEMWPIDKEIFDKTHEFVDESIVGSDAKSTITSLLKRYKGQEVPDNEVHAVAKQYGISPHALESYIYSLASAHVTEAKNSTYPPTKYPASKSGTWWRVPPASQPSKGQSWAAKNKRGQLKYFRGEYKAKTFALSESVRQIRPDLYVSENAVGSVRHFTSKRMAEMFTESRVQLGEAVSGTWKGRDCELEEDGDHLSSGGGTSSGATAHGTHISKQAISPDEIKIIDTNWQRIMKFSKAAFKAKPYPVALRAIEKFLEKVGVDNKHSGKVADVLARYYGMDTDPKSMIVPKVLPKVTQSPNVRGGGHFFGGHPRA